MPVNYLKCFFLLLSFFCPLSLWATNCLVSIPQVSFGVYNPFGSADDTANGFVYMTCSGRSPVNYSVQTNCNSQNCSPRILKYKGSKLNYNLYINAGRNQIWGDGQRFGSSLNCCSSEPCPFYGSIFKLQTSVEVGNYTDTIVYTVDY